MPIHGTEPRFTLSEVYVNYYKRHLGDYARDTGHLSALEHGIYCLLLDYYYSTEKPIPKDRAHKIARSNPVETQMVCDEFFISDGDTWRHTRADRDIAEYKEVAERNRQNGTKGGRPASQKEPRDNPVETQSVNSGNPSHKPLAISHKPIKEEAPLPASVDPIVWDSYLEMRKRKRSNPTARAKELIFKELAKLELEGHSANDVLEQSTRNSWLDVFPIRQKANGYASAADRQQTEIEKALASIRRDENAAK